MECFTLGWFENLLVLLVIIVGVVAVVRLLIPWLLSLVGTPPGGGIIVQVLQIILWCVIAIIVIYFVFDLLECGGGNFHLLRH